MARRPENSLPFSCFLCSFETRDKISISTHLNNNHNVKYFWCKWCGKATAEVNEYISHLENNVCAEPVEHPCGVENCSFSHWQPNNFIWHLKNQHRRTPLFPCSYCRRIFTMPTLLILHIQYDCCNRPTSSSSSVTKSTAQAPQSAASNEPLVSSSTIKDKPVESNSKNKSGIVKKHKSLFQSGASGFDSDPDDPSWNPTDPSRHYNKPTDSDSTYSSSSKKTKHSLKIKAEETSISSPKPNKYIDNIKTESQQTYFSSWADWFDKLSQLKSAEAMANLLFSEKVIHFYKCMNKCCSFSTNARKEFTVHITTEHKHLLHRCGFCFNKFDYGLQLVHHMLNEHSARRYQCSECLFRAVSKSYLKRHRKSVHLGENAQILVCEPQAIEEKHFPTKQAKHIEVRKSYNCRVLGCNFSTLMTVEFREHFSENHQNINYFSCCYCEFETTKFEQLVNHFRRHNIHDLECTYCGYGSDDRNDILTHMCINHSDIADNDMRILIRLPDEVVKVTRKTSIASSCSNDNANLTPLKNIGTLKFPSTPPSPIVSSNVSNMLSSTPNEHSHSPTGNSCNTQIPLQILDPQNYSHSAILPMDEVSPLLHNLTKEKNYKLDSLHFISGESSEHFNNSQCDSEKTIEFDMKLENDSTAIKLPSIDKPEETIERSSFTSPKGSDEYDSDDSSLLLSTLRSLKRKRSRSSDPKPTSKTSEETSFSANNSTCEGSIRLLDDIKDPIESFLNSNTKLNDEQDLTKIPKRKCLRNYNSKENTEDKGQGNSYPRQTFDCANCDKSFKTDTGIRKHALKAHSLIKRFKCSLCNFSSKLRSEFSFHGEKFHNGKDFDIIDISIKPIQQLISKIFNCIFCNTKISGQNEMIEHLSSELKVDCLSCQNCDFKSPSRHVIEKHCTNTKHTLLKENVSNCYIKKWILAYVNVEESENSEAASSAIGTSINVKGNQCTMCKKQFETNILLTEHLFVHLQYKPHECTVCFDCFFTNSEAEDHFTSKHGSKMRKAKVVYNRIGLIENYVQKLINKTASIRDGIMEGENYSTEEHETHTANTFSEVLVTHDDKFSSVLEAFSSTPNNSNDLAEESNLDCNNFKDLIDYETDEEPQKPVELSLNEKVPKSSSNNCSFFESNERTVSSLLNSPFNEGDTNTLENHNKIKTDKDSTNVRITARKSFRSFKAEDTAHTVNHTARKTISNNSHTCTSHKTTHAARKTHTANTFPEVFVTHDDEFSSVLEAFSSTPNNSNDLAEENNLNLDCNKDLINYQSDEEPQKPTDLSLNEKVPKSSNNISRFFELDQRNNEKTVFSLVNSPFDEEEKKMRENHNLNRDTDRPSILDSLQTPNLKLTARKSFRRFSDEGTVHTVNHTDNKPISSSSLTPAAGMHSDKYSTQLRVSSCTARKTMHNQSILSQGILVLDQILAQTNHGHVLKHTARKSTSKPAKSQQRSTTSSPSDSSMPFSNYNSVPLSEEQKYQIFKNVYYMHYTKGCMYKICYADFSDFADIEPFIPLVDFRRGIFRKI